MAISSNAMTLAEYANFQQHPLITRVVYSLRQAGSILTDVPFVTQPSMTAVGARWSGNLPSVTWVPINTAPTAVQGTPTQFQESAFLLRNTIEVDHLLMEDQNQIVNPMAVRLGAYIRAVAFDFNDKFLNNNHTTGDKNAIVGIRARLDDPTTYGTLSASKIDAQGAVITTAATVAQANAFLEWLGKLLWALDSPMGDGVVVYLNDDMQRRLDFLVRLLGTSGGFATTQDQYGRTVTTYKNAVIKDAGVKADQSTKIITSTEAADGTNGSSNYTSIYGVRYGEEYLSGWQFAPLRVENLGLDPTDGIVYRLFLEWAGGLMMPNVRAIARLYDLKIS